MHLSGRKKLVQTPFPSNRSANDEVAYRFNQFYSYLTAVLVKMPHYADAHIATGKTALSAKGYISPRPDDNTHWLEFLFPKNNGHRMWTAHGRTVWGEEMFKVFFCTDGPVLVVAPKLTTRIFSLEQMPDLCRHINTLVGVREPVSVLTS